MVFDYCACRRNVHRVQNVKCLHIRHVNFTVTRFPSYVYGHASAMLGHESVGKTGSLLKTQVNRQSFQAPSNSWVA